MNDLKSYFKGTKKAAFPLLYLYILAVMIIMICLNYELTACSLACSCIFCLLLTVVLFHMLQWLSDIRLPYLSRQNAKTTPALVILVLLITLAFYMLYFATKFSSVSVYNLGGDVEMQYSQAIGKSPYNNWHPVLHTLLFFTLPLKLVNSISFIVFMQILYFCLAFTYLFFVLYQCGAPTVFLLGYCLYIWLNPYLAGWSTYPFKDFALTIFATVLIGYYIRIICSKGMWLSKTRNVILFALITVCCTYMRHNALLFTIPLVLIVLFYAVKNRKTRCFITCSLVLMIALLQLLYLFLDVESPAYRTEEKIGLAVSVWCNVMQETPEALPEETREVMYELIPSEYFEQFDVTEGFNSIKFLGENYWDNLDALSYPDILKYTCQCFFYAPRESMEALASLIGIVISVDERISPMNLFYADNHLNLNEALFSRLSVFVLQIGTLFSNNPFKILFGSLGCINLCLVILSAIFLSGNRAAVLHSLPLLCYNIGTMVFLAGTEARYFTLTYPLWPVIIFLMFQDQTAFICQKPKSPKPDNTLSQ